MDDPDGLAERLRAVERAVSDADGPVAELADAGELDERTERLAGELEDLEQRVAELEAATRALRGYVGNVRSVNESVERRADAAVAAVERLESRIEEAEGDPAGSPTHRERTERSRRRTAADGDETVDEEAAYDVGTAAGLGAAAEAETEQRDGGAADRGVLERLGRFL